MRTLLARLPWRRNTPLLSPEVFALRCQEQATDLLRLARRLTRGNEDPAQDLVQDTLIRAFEAFLREEYHDQGNLRAYLMRILTNRFLSQKRRDRWDAGVDIETVPPPLSESAETLLVSQALDEPLERALAALPDGLRATILLVDIEGLEYSEAALALGIPLGTVRSRLFRARQILHQALLPCATAQGWLPVKEVV
ncbi:sigma-70 family RNA polymerase sigma factor [Armatimonas sp.]|uniref:RNA polymerase sigma factor n=1 Tax=Armatimonas sp. TaxID=1872638 RepID=UPI00286D03AE|nr:sigma-70 family RNA polymerase sigma factor [Armatimonas sp.]